MGPGVIEIVGPPADEVLDELGRSWRFHYPPLKGDELEDAALTLALEGEDPDLTYVVEPDELVSSVDSARELSNRLRSMERRASSEWIDKGVRVLYLGVCALEWSDAEDQTQHAPLLLVPVRLYRPSPREPFRLTSTDDDWVMNPALAVKLNLDFGIELPEVDDESSVASVMTSVRSAISSQPTWAVTHRLVLSTFSFQKNAMYQDLKENEAQILDHHLVRAIGLGDRSAGDLEFEPVDESRLDEIAPPEDLVSILDADATQRACIVAARDGHSFVMDGPPGTGKSQTIANIIAELIHAGQSVLFVSEKAAALDVVHERLKSAGLHHFVLELHSSKATRKEVAKALGEALETRPHAPETLSTTELAELVATRQNLNEYAIALNEIRQPLKKSLEWAIGRRSQLEQNPRGPVLDQVSASLGDETLAKMLVAAKQLSRNWGPVTRGDDFLWKELTNPAAARARLASLEVELDQLIELHGELVQVCGRLWRELGHAPRTDQAGIEWLVRLLDLLADPPSVELEWVTTPAFDELLPVLEQRRRIAEQLIADRADLISTWADWQDLPMGSSRPIVASLSRVRQIDSSTPTSENLTPLQLGGRSAELRQLSHQVAAVASAATEIAGFLSIDPVGDLLDASRMAELALLAGSPCRPEASWLTPGALASARTAAELLQPMIEQYRAMEVDLKVVFTDDMDTLDFDSLYGGERGVELNLSRLSSSGRSNRRQLKACTLDGKLSDAIATSLPVARRWQRLAGEIRDTEAARAGQLGDHYYKGVHTDFNELKDALDTAEQALVLARGANAHGLATRISRSALDTAGLHERGARLSTTIEELRSAASSNPNTATRLDEWSLESLRSWLDEAANSMEELAFSTSDVAAQISPKATVAEVAAFVQRRDDWADLESSFLSTRATDQHLLGPGYRGLETAFDELSDALEWVRSLRTLYGGPLDEADAASLDRLDPVLWRIPEQLRRRDKGFDSISELFELEQSHELRLELSGSAHDAKELLMTLRSTLTDIDEWSSFVDARSQLQLLGLDPLVEYCIEERLNPAEVPLTLERAVLSGWIDQQLAADARCRPLRSGERDHLVEEFRSLDSRLGRHSAARVINACSNRRPASAVGESAVIRTESQKKTRHRPIRKLLDDTSSVVRALKPCFMMSPLSVSQYLTSDFTFDVVIFDEASQVRPSDAINCIYRGRRLIVAGDEKQLPPSAFFDAVTSSESDEYDEDELEEFESVLSLCRRSASLRPLPLRWHYRSRHESLITFSNQQFYGGQLISYPGAHEDSPELGVAFFHVADGVYRRGANRDNPIEARRVVERVLFHAEHHPTRTLGVVAFSEAQATRIEQEVELARRARPDLDRYFAEDRLDGFFIKNLESVQGDERDIIIFSIGYGRDESGKFNLTMGALNRVGGERRLNVAVTRARRRVEVVASITSVDLPQSSGSAGVRALRSYLRYAAEGATALLPEAGHIDGEVESPFEAEVRKVIENLGYVVRSQVGHAGYRIDLGILHPHREGDYVLAVECDGAAYHSSKVARDRDRIRQAVLEGLGWQMYRVWGPAWYRDRPNEELRLQRAIERVVRGESLREQVAETPNPTPDVEVHAVEFDELPEWVIDYEPYVGYPWGESTLEIVDPRARGEIEELIQCIVDTEGPITIELCYRRVCENWGVQRRRRAISAVESVLKTMLSPGSQLREIEPGVLHIGDTPKTVRGGPPDGPAPRKVNEVPPCELRLAIQRLTVDALSIEASELQVQTARVFGWRRNGTEINTALDRAIVEAARLGLISVSADGRVRPSR